MSQSSLQPYNYSLHSIALAYGMIYPPHIYQFLKMKSLAPSTTTNVSPRSNLMNLKDKIPKATWEKLFRAQSAHFNAVEGFPLFAAAMVVGNMSRLPARDLNFCAAEYLVARALYTMLYINTKSGEAFSYVRSGVYFWSVGIPFYVLWKAANKFAEEVRL